MKRPICQRLCSRIMLLMACASGLMLSALDGCDAEVTTTVIGGLNTLSKTLIDAFFLAITPTTTTPVTTVQAVSDAITAMLC